MTDPSQPLPIRYVIIPCGLQPAVLLLHEGDAWTLPHVTQRRFYPFVAEIVTGIREQLGLNIWSLRCVYRHPASMDETPPRVFAVENHSPGWVPPGEAIWASEADLASLRLAVPEHRQVLSDWFSQWPARNLPERREPWAVPGWHDRAAAWISESAEQAGLHLTGPIEQVKVWDISCLLKVPSTGGELYFKATPPAFPAEVHASRALAALRPGLSPTLVAADPGRGWLLMRSFTGPNLGDVADETRWVNALRAYAQLQVELLSQMDGLLALGCLDRRLPVMLAQWDQLMADTTFLEAKAGLSAEQIANLKRLTPEIRQMAEELDALPIPPSLEHGDLHPYNIACQEDGFVFFDWSDACLAHPFFSLGTFLEARDETALAYTPEMVDRLQEAYLEPWSGFANPDQLRRAVELAGRLAPVHFAMSYYAYLAPAVEEPSLWNYMAAKYLKALLSELKGA